MSGLNHAFPLSRGLTVGLRPATRSSSLLGILLQSNISSWSQFAQKRGIHHRYRNVSLKLAVKIVAGVPGPEAWPRPQGAVPSASVASVRLTPTRRSPTVWRRGALACL